MKIEKLYDLRHKLHQHAELSHCEIETSRLLKKFLQPLKPYRIFDIENGFFLLFESKVAGPVTVFRADIDALPIEETNNFNHKSQNQGTAHLCGHDGHMTILSGLAEEINRLRPLKGKTVLLFQPAEEIGEGAKLVVESKLFQDLKPDYIFGLHNIPGFKESAILLKEGCFASASRGMIIKLFGKTAHAGEPENGLNPVFAIEKIIKEFYQELKDKQKYQDFYNLTIIHLRLGEIAFGTSPGYAEVMVTLRSTLNEDMAKLVKNCEEKVARIAEEEKLKQEVSYREVFPATMNNNACVELVRSAALSQNMDILNLTTPFKWSEDFSYYTNQYKGAFFGLGSGENHPSLHNPDYDFPDEIIKTGIDVFFNIYKQIHR